MPTAEIPADRREVSVVTDSRAELRGAVVAIAAVLAAVLGWVVFVVVPTTLADLLGVLLVGAALFAGARLGGRIADSRFPDYDVAEVAVTGPITRDGGSGSIPARATGTPADDVVDQIAAADDDDAVDALLVKLNTPGGEVVPSDDIRRAAMAFDGPTVAYATDVCASGGYWIASGCDELWARDASLVGSIGVIGSSVNVSDLADDLGVSYERFVAGEYKDAGVALKDLSEDERAYLQGIIDGFYEDFVERVAEGRGMDPEAVRDTEARIFLGETARDLGLVDDLGDRDDVEARTADRLDRESVTVEEFEPDRGMLERLRGGAASTAYAFGVGVASQFAPDDEFRFRS
jgi:protease-4